MGEPAAATALCVDWPLVCTFNVLFGFELGVGVTGPPPPTLTRCIGGCGSLEGADPGSGTGAAVVAGF